VACHGLLFLLCLILLLLPCRLAAFQIEAAQSGLLENGIPPFLIQSSESLGLQTPPFDLAELPDGRILLVGANELVIGDGVRWELIQKSETESGFLSGQVSVDARGGIWSSQFQGFAKVGFNASGKWFLEKPIPLPDHEHRQWSAFTQNRRINGQDYWWGSALVAWSPDAEQPAKVLSMGTSLDHVFQLGTKLYATSPSTGNVLRIEPDGSVEEVFGKHYNAPASSILCSAPLNSGSLLVGTVLHGIGVFNGSSLRPLVTSGPLSGGARISDLCRARNGTYAAAIDAVGIVFFDKDGRIIQTLDRSIDHRFGQVKRLLRRSDGSLWALFSRGIIRIDYPSRISYIDPLLSASADYVAPVRHEGRLWLLATGRILKGVYENNRLASFETDTPDTRFAYTLASVNGHLIVGGTDGIYLRKPEGWHLVTRDITNLRITPLSLDGRRWLYVARQEIGWIDLGGERPSFERIPTPELIDVYNSIKDGSGNVWLELGAARVARLSVIADKPVLRIFGPQDGVADGWVEAFTIDESLRINCSGRTLRFAPNLDRFVNDLEITQRYPELLNTIGGRPARDAHGRIWIPDTDIVRIVSLGIGEASRHVEHLPADLKPGTFVCSPDGVVWMQERLRFARYDPSMPAAEMPPPKAIITRIHFPSSGRMLLSPARALPDITHDNNTLIAHFAASCIPYGERVTFEILVDGMGDQWIPTGVTGSAMLNSLKEGNYLLKVRPRLSTGVGEEAQLGFTILPPWYRTTLAYAAYAALGLCLILAIVLIPLRLERTQKRRLAVLVAERTRDLSSSEERYRKLSEELEQRVEERTRALDQTAARLTAANQELESFSYSVSHDLRAPLRNITGFIELMDRKIRAGSAADCVHHMEIVISEAKRMASLIEDLLIFSRLTRSELKSEKVFLQTLIEEVRQELSNELQARLVEWTISDLPPVQGDRSLLRQVIANLIGNAVKFTKGRQRAIISVSCDPTPDANGYIFFHIKDNGAGFNPKYSTKLFGVFQRLHSAKDFDGTGIGLANVKRIVTRHGGQVRAEGQPDQGATFSFSLKLVP